MRIVSLLLSSLLVVSTGPAFSQKSPSAPTTSADVLPVGGLLPFGDHPLLDVRTQKAVYMDSLIRPQGLLVMFSCNTCPYVVKSQARTLEMVAFAQSRDIPVVIINSNEARRGDDDSPKAMVDYAMTQGYSVPYVLDPGSAIADQFGATRTPEVFLFNGGHKLVYKGAMEDNPASPKESKKLYLKTAITNMVAGKAIDPATTRSIGCSIKRQQP